MDFKRKENVIPSDSFLVSAARKGDYAQVDLLLKGGADPHACCSAGVHILQLAVASKHGWSGKRPKWDVLLSRSTIEEITKAAAAAMALNRTDALKHLIATNKCDMKLPTLPTGHTLESLAKVLGLKVPKAEFPLDTRAKRQMQSQKAFLSPSVENFFKLSASCPDLSGSPQQYSPILTTKQFFPSYSHLNSPN